MKSSIIKRDVVGRLAGAVPLLVLFILWEASARLKFVNPIFLPPISEILKSLVQSIKEGSIIWEALSTMKRCIGGYFAAIIIGVPLGFLMGRYNWVNFLMNALIEFLRPIPSAAIIPVAILFLGIDEKMKMFVIAFGSLWPILLNTYQGVRTTDPLLMDTGRTLQLSEIQINLKLILPASLPFIAAGLRISLAISFILAITSEMIAGGDGLGFLIIDCERAFQYKRMYAGILLLGFIGFIFNSIFVLLQRRFLFWSENLPPES